MLVVERWMIGDSIRGLFFYFFIFLMGEIVSEVEWAEKEETSMWFDLPWGGSLFSFFVRTLCVLIGWSLELNFSSERIHKWWLHRNFLWVKFRICVRHKALCSVCFLVSLFFSFGFLSVVAKLVFYFCLSPFVRICGSYPKPLFLPYSVLWLDSFFMWRFTAKRPVD